MIEIKLLEKLDSEDLKQVITSYSSPGKYVVIYSDSPTQTTFNIEFQMLERPYTGQFNHLDSETLKSYREALKHGYSFGAFDQDGLVGILLSERHDWNKSLWVWEFHVREAMRGSGIGRRLMAVAAQKAKEAGLRTIVCETQNTNATAIHAYRRLGFAVEAVDISYYSNNDYPDGTVAIFMKRRL